MICAAACIAPQKVSAQVSVSYQVFYDDLSPHGVWVDNPNYGYVWVPNVSPGFTPYATNGHWVYTDMGWTWVSNYSWGWAPFHYGRWYSDPQYGYVWVPGNEWGPGWVTWRSYNGYYGWAPIGPGVSLSVAYGSGYSVPYNQWTFVSGGYMGRTNINNYYVNNNSTYVNNSTVINNTQVNKTSNVSYNAGPSRMQVEKNSGKTITPVALKGSSKTGQTLSGNQLQIYKPQVQKSSGAQKPAPSKVSTMKELKPASQRTSGGAPQKKEQPVRQQAKPTQPSGGEKQPQRAQPSQQKTSQPQRSVEPKREQPQQQRNEQPVRQQPQHTAQPAREQPSQPQRSVEPQRERRMQPQHNEQPMREQQQHNSQPEQRQAPPQQSQPQQSPPQQQQHGNPQQNNGGQNRPH